MMPLPVRDDPDVGIVRRCSRCGEEWPLDAEFWIPQSTPRSVNDRWYGWCRGCRRDRQAARKREVRADVLLGPCPCQGCGADLWYRRGAGWCDRERRSSRHYYPAHVCLRKAAAS